MKNINFAAVKWQESRDTLYGKHNLIPLVRKDIGDITEIEGYDSIRVSLLAWISEPAKYESKQRRKNILNELDSEEIILSVIISILSREMINIQAAATLLGSLLGLRDRDIIVGGAEVLAVCEHPSFYELEAHTMGIDIIVNAELEESTRQTINELLYPPPRIIPPLDWTSNVGTSGYIILGNAGKLMKHNCVQSYDALNTLQNIELFIDEEALKWENPVYDVIDNEEPCMDYKAQAHVIRDLRKSPFYFIWKYDSRGRMYSQGYHINIQGTEWDKSLISIKPEKVESKDALFIGIANHAGQDKLSWSERVDWVVSNIDPEKLHDDTYIEATVQEWDEPYLGAKALRAYRDTLDGKPTGYMVGLDATSSGLQMLSILSGCQISAETCNLIDTGKREDVYLMLVDKMNGMLKEGLHVDRKLVKKPLMTALYNSKRVPERAFTGKQLMAFNKSMKGVFPGVMDAMNIINEFWDADAVSHSWIMPDGHWCVVPVVETVESRIEVDELDHVRFTYLHTELQPSENYRSLVANITHSVDAYVCREMIRKCNFTVLPIHDNFMCHPNHINELKDNYRNILADIADSDLLKSILEQISGEVIMLEKDSDDLGNLIRTSVYGIC